MGRGGANTLLQNIILFLVLLILGTNTTRFNLERLLVPKTTIIVCNQTLESQDGASIYPSKRREDTTAHIGSTSELVPLQVLTKGDVRPIECPEPLVPVYNYIPSPSEMTAHMAEESRLFVRRIPRIIHMSMKERCVPPDFWDTFEHWKTNFPHHEIYFHNDEAVDTLFQIYDWPEFPHLFKVMQCLKKRGAMKIDVWRILIIYLYGGIYTDIDNWPTKNLNESSPIKFDDDAFFLSDHWGRPSQWFFAMIPRHPIAYHTVYEILNRLWKLDNIADPAVVFTTGPDALKHGYIHGLSRGKYDYRQYKDDIFAKGRHRGRHGITASKLSGTDYYMTPNALDAIVNYNGKNITKKQRAQAQSGVPHWSKDKLRDSFKGSCRDYLYMMENNINDGAK